MISLRHASFTHALTAAHFFPGEASLPSICWCITQDTTAMVCSFQCQHCPLNILILGSGRLQFERWGAQPLPKYKAHTLVQTWFTSSRSACGKMPVNTCSPLCDKPNAVLLCTTGDLGIPGHTVLQNNPWTYCPTIEALQVVSTHQRWVPCMPARSKPSRCGVQEASVIRTWAAHCSKWTGRQRLTPHLARRLYIAGAAGP